MTFGEFCKMHRLSEREARACAHFLAFTRMQKLELQFEKIINQTYRKSPKARKP